MSVTLIKKRQIENLAIVDADISSSAAISTSKLADGANFIKKDGSVTYTAAQPMGGHKITGLGAPVASDDAARLVDVQNASLGILAKDAARVATTGNITLSGPQTIDGISVIAGDRVLVKNQTTGSENGIYVCAAAAWARSTDANTSALMKSGTFIFVCEGTVNADSGWILSTDGTITLGTTTLTFVQFSGAGSVTAGTGLTKTGNTINANGNVGRIVVNADDIDLATVAGMTVNTFGASGTKKVCTVTTDTYGRITAISEHDMTCELISAQPVSNILTSLSALATVGILVQSVAGTVVGRSLAEGTGISITNGSGAAGNPTIALASGVCTADTYTSVTVDTYGRVTAGTNPNIYSLLTSFISKETPTGTINGTNAAFTLANTPITGSEEVYLNGVLLDPGTGNDYTILGATITMLVIPISGDKLRVSYRK